MAIPFETGTRDDDRARDRTTRRRRRRRRPVVSAPAPGPGGPSLVSPRSARRSRRRRRQADRFFEAINPEASVAARVAARRAELEKELRRRGNRPGGPTLGNPLVRDRPEFLSPGEAADYAWNDPTTMRQSGFGLEDIPGGLENIADFYTGIPTFVRDPSLENFGWMAAAAPLKGVGGLGRAAARGTRRVGAPVANSRIGRGVDSLYDRAIGQSGRARREGKEIARDEKIRGAVTGSVARTLERLTRKLTGAEQTALRAVIEGTPIDQRLALHTARREASEGVERSFHDIHVKLLNQARDLVRVGRDGLEFTDKASGSLREALRLSLQGTDQREHILSRLNELLDAAADTRRAKPGRVYRGAQAVRLSLAEAGRPHVGMWVRAAGQNNFGRIVSLDGDSAMVHFVNKTEGTEATVRLPLSQLFDPKRGKTLVGGEGADLSRGYLPYERGIPGSIRTNPVRYTAARMRTNRGVITMLARDANARKEFTGALIQNGRFATDTTRASAKAIFSAVRLDAVDNLRQRLLALARPADEIVGDISDWQPIKINPRKNMSDTMRQLFDTLDAHEALDPKLLQKLNADIADNLKDEVFPAVTNSLLNDPNIMWVSRDLYDGVFYQDGIARMGRDLFGQRGFMRKGSAAMGEVWNGLNDIARVAFLYANPHYYTLNFVGNNALAVMQQGIFLPRNIKNAMRLSTKLKMENINALDEAIGQSFSKTLAGFGKNATSKVVHPIADFANKTIDLLPRRSAFFHEAHTLGYKDGRAVDALIDRARAGDKRAMDDFVRITRKANDALIDYGRLSPIERNIVTKMIFFYPFLKGASRYSLRFPLEHPFQAAAVAWLGYEQQRAREQLGDGPWYTMPLIQIPDEIPEGVPGIGGMDLPFSGQVTNLSPLVPFGVVPEVAQTIYGAATGAQNTPEAAGYFNPIIQSGIEAITGRDEFGQELEGNIFERFGSQLYEDIPWKRKFDAFTSTENERERRLYPRDTEDIIGQIVGGSVAPTPYNQERAEEIAEDDNPTAKPSRYEQTRREKRQKFKDFYKRYGEKVPKEITDLIDLEKGFKDRLAYARNALKEELFGEPEGDLGELREAHLEVAVLIEMLIERDRLDEENAEIIRETKNGAAKELVYTYRRELREMIGFSQLDAWERELDKQLEKASA